MRQPHGEDIYKSYEKFVDVFLFKNNSILSEHNNILRSDTIRECLECFIENYDEGARNFDEKIMLQFKDATLESKLVFAHAEWLWSFAVNDISKNKKKHYTIRTTGLSGEDLLDEIYPNEGFGSAGQWHTNNKYYEISFNLLVIQFLHNKIKEGEITTVEEVKLWMENICLFKKYEEEVEGYLIPDELKKSFPENKLSMSNILTYVANPDVYERIASDTHKNQIVQSFKTLLVDDKGLNLDKKILEIRRVLTELTENQELDFYDNRYVKVWNYSLLEEGFDEVQGLQYKKAIILHGPPGTSKTYSAKRLAKALINNSYLKDKANVLSYFKSDFDPSKGKIHHLQLHPNYTYEDFVAGYQLKDKESKATKGLLFSICESAEKDKGSKPEEDIPHVLILDEINRVDLSRLFGEVFSALENRETVIKLGVGGLELSIPRNLYVIGTMNEIDFSLEQIDFALQRRFLWFFYGFNEGVLNDIINYKNETLTTRLKLDDDVKKFVDNVVKLNKRISEIPELGKEYQLGHTFFGEIVDIYKSYKEIGGYKSLQKQLYRTKGPVSILWDISIEPMLKSFLGNMEPEQSDVILKELNAILLPK